MDVQATMSAFEHINNVRLTVEMDLSEKGGKQDIRLTARAWDLNSDDPDPSILASASVTCWATNLKTLSAATTHVLYLLDGKIAEGEMAAARNQKA
jgi:hypothetical protein